MIELQVNIKASYQKVYEITAETVAQALDASEDQTIPSAMTQDLLKNAHDSAYAFVDSVVNVNKYTNNPELAKEIQTTHMDGAIAMYDRIFDAFYDYTKVWQEVASARE